MPKVICHMISSVDGRLYPSRWTPAEADVSAVYEQAASQFDAQGWIVGRTTMAEYADSICEQAPAARRTDGSRPQPWTGEHAGRMLAVVFDPHAKLHYQEPVLPTGEHLVAVLSPETGDDYLEELRRTGVSYVFAEDPAGGLAALEGSFGVQTLLLEGGGIINGAFLKAGLIDELSILIYPAVDGLAGVSSIISCPGQAGDLPAQGQRLELTSSQTFPGGVVWLRYKVLRA